MKIRGKILTDKTEIVTVSIEHSIRERVDQLAVDSNKSRSMIYREAIKDYLRSKEGSLDERQ